MIVSRNHILRWMRVCVLCICVLVGSFAGLDQTQAAKRHVAPPVVADTTGGATITIYPNDRQVVFRGITFLLPGGRDIYTLTFQKVGQLLEFSVTVSTVDRRGRTRLACTGKGNRRFSPPLQVTPPPGYKLIVAHNGRWYDASEVNTCGLYAIAPLGFPSGSPVQMA